MEGAEGSYKCKGKALACPTTVPVTKDPDEVIKQPTTTQAEYEKDGNADLIEAMNNDHKKNRTAEGEPDKVPVKQNKQVIDLNEEPPESSWNTNDDYVRVTADLLCQWRLITDECGNEICHSGPCRSSGTSSDPVDLELRLGLGSWNNDDEKKRKAEGEPDKVPMKQKKQVIDINEEPPESSQNMTADLLRGFGNEICHSAAGSTGTSSEPVDLELRLDLANS